MLLWTAADVVPQSGCAEPHHVLVFPAEADTHILALPTDELAGCARHTWRACEQKVPWSFQDHPHDSIKLGQSSSSHARRPLQSAAASNL